LLWLRFRYLWRTNFMISVFPVSRWFCIPLYTSCSAVDKGEFSDKKNYNAILSQTRILIQHAFGDIINTFRRLHYIYAHVEKAMRII
jgi:hypothetical protein